MASLGSPDRIRYTGGICRLLIIGTMSVVRWAVRDAVFIGFGDVILVTVELLDPERASAGLLEVEEAGVEDVGQRDVAEVGLGDPCAGVEAADDAAGVGQPLRARGGHLVEDDNIAELDLVDKELRQGAPVLSVALLAAVSEEVVAGEVACEVSGVDDGQHRVEPGDVGKADASGVAEVEGGGDRQRPGNAGRLDEQIIEAAVGGEAAYLGQEVAA